MLSAGGGGAAIGGIWPWGVQVGEGFGGGEGVKGGGGRGCFIHLAIYCTTTWCFALKGLRTMNRCSLN